MTTKPSQITAYFEAFGRGHTRKDAARIAGISIRTAGNIERRYSRYGTERIPGEVAVIEPGHCCSEVGCRRTHPVLIRKEGSRWYAVTRYTQKVTGGLSIAEKHDITEQFEAARS